MKQLVFATNNEHKLTEVRAILKDTYQVLSLKDINCFDDIPETADNLEDNARQKAQYIYDHYHVDCFADDSVIRSRSFTRSSWSLFCPLCSFRRYC